MPHVGETACRGARRGERDACPPPVLRMELREAPEGGWGYMVCLGFALIFSLFTLLMPSFGLIYNDFLEDLGEGTSGTTMVNGVFSAVVSCAGFLTTSALKRYTLRQVGIFGALCYVGGSFMGIFITSVMELVIAIGIIQGIGFGIMIPIGLTCFNEYFMVKRAAMMSLSSLIVGCSAMVFPMLIKVLFEEYGFRGTLAIIAALNLHVIFAMALMQPIEWHSIPKRKPMKVIRSNKDLFSETKGTKEKIIIVKPHDLKKIEECKHDEEEKEADEESDSFFRASSATPRRGLLRETSSLVSIGNWTGNVLATETVQNKSGKWKTLIDFLDLTLLKDLVYSNICFGITFAFFSDTTFFMLEPYLLHSYGFSKSEIAICVTAGAASDLVSRGLFAIIHFYVTVNSRMVFFSGNCFIVVLRIAFYQYTDFFSVVLLTAALGFFRSWLHVLLPLVIADHFTNEKFPSAYGLFMIVSGAIVLFLAPLVGLVTDLTGSQVAGFHSLTVCSLLCVLPWAAEMIYTKSRAKTLT